MARQSTTFSSGVQFINYDLTPDERKALKKWASAPDFNLQALIDQAIRDGFTVSIKGDEYNDCVAAFITPVGEEHPCHGWILTGRGKDSYGAWLGAFFRHTVVFKDGWPKQKGRRVVLDDD
jgi:hypothetical protein